MAKEGWEAAKDLGHTVAEKTADLAAKAEEKMEQVADKAQEVYASTVDKVQNVIDGEEAKAPEQKNEGPEQSA